MIDHDQAIQRMRDSAATMQQIQSMVEDLRRQELLRQESEIVSNHAAETVISAALRRLERGVTEQSEPIWVMAVDETDMIRCKLLGDSIRPESIPIKVLRFFRGVEVQSGWHPIIVTMRGTFEIFLVFGVGDASKAVPEFRDQATRLLHSLPSASA